MSNRPIPLGGTCAARFWGGWADEARTTPWTKHTITNVFSTTKTMTALAALVLVDRGGAPWSCMRSCRASHKEHRVQEKV